MKRIDTLALTLATVLLAYGCDKEPVNEGFGTIHLQLENPDDTRSRTDSEAYETTIHNLQVIVADAGGKIESCRELNGNGGFDIPAKPGDKTVLAIANGPSLQSCVSLEQIRGTEMELTQWNSISGGFVMSGERECKVAVDSISSLSMRLERYVSRVRFLEVSNRLPLEYGSLTVTGVMISNAVGNQNIAGNAQVQTWLNPMGFAEGGRTPAILGTVKNQPLRKNAIYKLDTKMYCYPNSTASDNQGYGTSFTPRYTRAILSATIQGKEYYYPISLPHLERNTSYDITLSVYHPGSTDPDIPVCPGYIRVSINAGPWQEAPGITEHM